MKYIGNKTRLLDFIYNSVILEKLPNEGIFCDIFLVQEVLVIFLKLKIIKLFQMIL